MSAVIAAGIQPNDAQRVRDACHLRTACAACGHSETPRNPLVLAGDGYRVHVRHLTDPASGLYGVPFQEAAS